MMVRAQTDSTQHLEGVNKYKVVIPSSIPLKLIVAQANHYLQIKGICSKINKL